MKTMRWIAMLWLAASTAQAADDASKVLECMQRNVPLTLRVQDVEFATRDRAGTTSTLKGRLYAEREKTPEGALRVRAMLHLSAPPNLAGAAYLIRERESEPGQEARDGMYVYLPSVRRVRRVTGSIADGGLMGTSFSYADFKQMQNTFGDTTATLEGTGEIDKRPMHVLAFKPRNAADGGYSLVRSWVDFKTCVPLKMEFYEGTSVRKRATSPVNALKEAEGYGYPSVIEMHDLKDDLRTTLRVHKVAPDKSLSGGYFDPKTFYQR